MDEKEKKRKLFLLKMDFFFNKAIPKKLIVWIVATIALFMGYIDGWTWMILTGIYLGANIVGKFSPVAGNTYQALEMDQPVGFKPPELKP